MDKKPFDGPMKWLGLAFVGYFAGWIIFLVAAPDNYGVGEPGETVAFLGVALLLASCVTYLVCLGMVAARTGRSVIIWVGLTFLTSPFGYLAAYPMMRSKIKEDATKVVPAS